MFFKMLFEEDHRLYLSGEGLNFAKWIYTDSILFMDRKYQQYQEPLNSGGGGMP